MVTDPSAEWAECLGQRGGTWTVITNPGISAEELAEFRALLERAREYDKRTGQPDCELNEKRQAVKNIARQLGVEIAFL